MQISTVQIGLWTTNKVCSVYLATLKYCGKVLLLILALRNLVLGTSLQASEGIQTFEGRFLLLNEANALYLRALISNIRTFKT